MFLTTRSAARRTRPAQARRLHISWARLDLLEDRSLMSADPVVHPFLDLMPAVTNPTPPDGAYTPQQARNAYGFDEISFDGISFVDYSGKAGPLPGTGQTIAIVGAFYDNTVFDDLNTFDAQYGLFDPNTPSDLTKPDAHTFLTQVGQTGGDPSRLKQNAGWSLETALDVEWAHAIAPGARLLLVESKSENLGDMLAAVDYAGQHADVVSMSWGYNEFGPAKRSLGEVGYDSHFAQSGVTYVAASGDSGQPPFWPAASPNVLAVGGTTAAFDSNGNYLSETGWGNGVWSWLLGGSGGGPSQYESRPGYQTGHINAGNSTMPQSARDGGKRLTPDVAYDSDPSTGFPVYSSATYQSQSGWFQAGGTSDAAPQWAGLIAIADQGLGSSLDGFNQTLPAIYQMGATNQNQYFHDITSGDNGYAAGPGYDLVTGWGTPRANEVVNGLITLNGSPMATQFAATAPGRISHHDAIRRPAFGGNPRGLHAGSAKLSALTSADMGPFGYPGLLGYNQGGLETAARNFALGTRATDPGVWADGSGWSPALADFMHKQAATAPSDPAAGPVFDAFGTAPSLDAESR